MVAVLVSLTLLCVKTSIASARDTVRQAGEKEAMTRGLSQPSRTLRRKSTTEHSGNNSLRNGRPDYRKCLYYTHAWHNAAPWIHSEETTPR